MQQKHPDPICTKLIQLLKYSVTNDKIQRRVLYTIYKSRRSLAKDPGKGPQRSRSLARNPRGHGLWQGPPEVTVSGKGSQRSRSLARDPRGHGLTEVTVLGK